MKTVTLEVPDMACGHCAKTVEGALCAVAGVESVDVSLDRKTAEVRLAGEVPPGALAEAVRRAGYTPVE